VLINMSDDNQEEVGQPMEEESPAQPPKAANSVNPTNKYITERTLYRRHGLKGEDLDDKFDVRVPKSNIVLFVILFIVLVAGMWYYIQATAWWIVLIFLVLSIVPVLLWGKLGTTFGEKNDSVLDYDKSFSQTRQ
jgi:hypothetical protein